MCNRSKSVQPSSVGIRLVQTQHPHPHNNHWYHQFQFLGRNSVGSDPPGCPGGAAGHCRFNSSVGIRLVQTGRRRWKRPGRSGFNSSVGIRLVQTQILQGISPNIYVSIPRSEFGWFRPFLVINWLLTQAVSIPRSEFGWFRPPEGTGGD